MHQGPLAYIMQVRCLPLFTTLLLIPTIHGRRLDTIRVTALGKNLRIAVSSQDTWDDVIHSIAQRTHLSAADGGGVQRAWRIVDQDGAAVSEVNLTLTAS